MVISNQQATYNYKDQLNTRFHSNSMSLEVLVCLILIFILIIEIVKFIKKTYEWQTDYQLKIQHKFTEQSRSILKQKSYRQGDQKQKPVQKGKEEQAPRSRERKKEPVLPAIIRIEQIIKNKLPQIAIIGINVAMIASYEYCVIVSYIAIVIIVISQIIGNEHVKLKFGLEVISKILLFSLYFNFFTVPKPRV